jgi:hypothetical protein
MIQIKPSPCAIVEMRDFSVDGERKREREKKVKNLRKYSSKKQPERTREKKYVNDCGLN